MFPMSIGPCSSLLLLPVPRVAWYASASEVALRGLFRWCYLSRTGCTSLHQYSASWWPFTESWSEAAICSTGRAWNRGTWSLIPFSSRCPSNRSCALAAPVCSLCGAGSLLCSYPLDRLAAAVTCLAQAQVAARRQLCDRLSRPCLQVAILLPAQNLPGTSLHYRCALRMFGRLASGRPRISHDWHKLEKKEERKVR